MEQPKLGVLIADLRKKQGLTQEELVDRCNINVRTIQRIEAGEVNPRSYTIKNILEALGTTIDDVFQDDKKEHYKEVVNEEGIAIALNGNVLIAGGISGIIYMIFITLLIITSFSNSISSEKLFSNSSYTLISISSFVFLLLFYGTLMYLAKHKINQFFVYASLAFILICAVTTLIDIHYYTNDLYNGFTNASEIIVTATSSFVYGMGFIFMGVALFIQRKTVGNIAKWGGIAGIVGGLGFATIILFPAGILGTLIFEVLLIALLFMSASHKKAFGTHSKGPL
jgi:transcriptional regulator with XRE-family HTH domain